jgi:hypothetical protein
MIQSFLRLRVVLGSLTLRKNPYHKINRCLFEDVLACRTTAVSALRFLRRSPEWEFAKVKIAEGSHVEGNFGYFSPLTLWSSAPGHWKQERKQLFFPAVSSGFEHASCCSHAGLPSLAFPMTQVGTECTKALWALETTQPIHMQADHLISFPSPEGCRLLQSNNGNFFKKVENS